MINLGYEKIIEKNENYVLKELFMKKGHQCSLQYHEIKHETVYILKGNLHIFYNDDWKIFLLRDSLILQPGEIHRMKAVDEDCLYLEASTPELDDVIKFKMTLIDRINYLKLLNYILQNIKNFRIRNLEDKDWNSFRF